MKKYLGTIFALSLAFGTAALAQNPNNQNPNNKNKDVGSHEQVQNTKTTTDNGTNKTTTDKVFGKVEAYDVGKSIKVTTPGKNEGSRTIDLTGKNVKLNAPSDINLGDWVQVTQTTYNNGNKMITIKHSKEAARSQQR